MKKVIAVVLAAPLLVSVQLTGQHMATHPGFGGGVGFSRPAGFPRAGLISQFGSPLGRQGFGRNFWNRNNAFLGYGWGDLGYYPDAAYPAGYAEGSQATPNVVVVMPMQEVPVPVAPPPPPARPEIREYSWPAQSGNVSAVFSIFPKGGSERFATAVWVQGEVLCYTTPDGSSGRIPLASVDRQRTFRENAEKHLTLSLPASR